MYYETGLMTGQQAAHFQKWFDKTIGTDSEKNQDDDNSYYFILCDLEDDEEYEAIDKWLKDHNIAPV